MLSDTTIRFDVPAWVDTSKNGNSPFPDSSRAANITVISDGATPLVSKDIVVFDLLTSSTSQKKPVCAFDEQVDNQAKALKALLAAQEETNSPPRLSGILRIEVGTSTSAPMGTNSQANGSSSAVIIQNGQNSGTAH